MGQIPPRLPDFGDHGAAISPDDGKMYVDLGYPYTDEEVTLSWQYHPHRLIIKTQKRMETPLGPRPSEPLKSRTIHFTAERDMSRADVRLRNDGILVIDVPYIQDFTAHTEARWNQRARHWVRRDPTSEVVSIEVEKDHFTFYVRGQDDDGNQRR